MLLKQNKDKELDFNSNDQKLSEKEKELENISEKLKIKDSEQEMIAKQ